MSIYSPLIANVTWIAAVFAVIIGTSVVSVRVVAHSARREADRKVGQLIDKVRTESAAVRAEAHEIAGHGDGVPH